MTYMHTVIITYICMYIVCIYVCMNAYVILFDLKCAVGFTSELQQFMITYDKFATWLQETLNTAVTRSETKHSVGVTESKLEEHKVVPLLYIFSTLLCTYVCMQK